MSFFNKIKNKKVQAAVENSPAETKSPPVPQHMEVPVEPVPEPEAKSKPAANEDILMHELHIRKKEHPTCIPEIIPHLAGIRTKIKERTDMIALTKETEESDPSISESAAADLAAAVSLDAAAEVIISGNRMTAFVYVLAPAGSGSELDENMLPNALKNNKIVYGIDQQLVQQIYEQKLYHRIYPVAFGLSPVNGENGKITEHFSRTQDVHLSEDEHGVIDYKSLNIFQSIRSGDTICDILLPTPGQDGYDVLGHVLRAKPGKAPSIPKGKHTIVNAEGTALIAEIDGNISFHKDVFQVDPQLTISENVDGSTGNIEFSGDICIKGDVCKGFQVKAGGNIGICGMAEGAEIIAEGNIDIKKGMNGSGEGSLQAGGSIKSRFLEQTTVNALGDVTCDTIINCKIKSGGSITAVSGKGIIIGGILIAANNVLAKRIGNYSNVKTTIKIGHFNQSAEVPDTLNADLKKQHELYNKINKNINFLEGLPSLTDEKKELFGTLKAQRNLYKNMIIETKRKLEELSSQRPDYTQCHVKGDIIYGVTEVSLNHSMYIIKDATNKCHIYYSEGELVAGTY